MRLWPFKGYRYSEKRSYTDAYVHALIAQAERGPGGVGTWEELDVIHAALREYSAAFDTAGVMPDTAGVVTPALLAMAVRRMIRTGNVYYRIDFDRAAGRVSLTPFVPERVEGTTTDPLSWTYRFEGRNIRGLEVLHFRTGADTLEPWKGISPFVAMRDTIRLRCAVETALAHEYRLPVGVLFPLPQGMDPAEVKVLQSDLETAAGAVLFPTTTQVDHISAGGVPRHDWKGEKIRPEPPGGSLQLRAALNQSILGALGLHVSASGGPASDAREGMRRFWVSVLEPLAANMAAELTLKLDAYDAPFSVQFKYQQADLAARARALKGLVDAGVDLQRGMTLTGFETEGGGRGEAA